MKPRYNLRCASKASNNSDFPTDIYETGIDYDKNDNDDADNYDTLLARHHRRMIAEQKDRKNYERYVRDQRALRRLQCRKTHTAHLNETTRQRLLRGLERERRHLLHEQICAHVEQRSLVFKRVQKSEDLEIIDWKVLEEDLLENSKATSIHQLDSMINHLKRLMRTAKSAISKPRLSVRERQKQRLAKSSSTSLLDFHLPLPIASLSPHIPLVRYIDHQQSQTSNAQQLTCIQNVLTSNQQQSSSIVLRKSMSRTQSLSTITMNVSPSVKTPVEKENCNATTTTTATQGNIVLRTGSPMVSLKQTISRSYAKTRRQIKNI